MTTTTTIPSVPLHRLSKPRGPDRLLYYNPQENHTMLSKGKSQLDSSSDQVNNPNHYTGGTIECWDYLKDNMPREAYLGGLEWNIKKYLHRWRYKKNPVEDLKKAKVYLDKLINEMESKDV